MPTATAIEWMDTTEYAETPTPRDLMEFFGIPPSPPEELGENIRAKRKYWKEKEQKARSDEYPRFTAFRSVVILEAAQSVPGIVLDPQLLQSAIGGAYQVLHQIGPS